MTIRRKQQLKRRRQMKSPAHTGRVLAAMEKSEQMWRENFGINVRYLP